MDKERLVTLTSEIVAAQASGGGLGLSEIPGFIRTVFLALSEVSGDVSTAAVLHHDALSVAEAGSSDQVVCLECGARMQMLKRHLRVSHRLTPEDYRARWRLPFDHPIVSSRYSQRRASLAKEYGLGLKRVAEVV